MSRKLTLDDIADLRAYERERQDFRAHIIEVKRARRVSIGPIITLLFENRETIRFQIQEMARAERILTDEGIRTELGIYNPLIPEPGQLVATLFVELTSKDALMEWLPRLVGIERAVELRLASGQVVRCVPDEDHAEQLTRDDVTASVHYIRFELSEDEVAAFVSAGGVVAVNHPAYQESTVLGPDTVASLAADLLPEPVGAR